MRQSESMNDLAYLSATDARAHFTAGEVSPAEVLEAQIAAAQSSEPLINAYTETLYDEARAAAREAEARYRSGDARPLEGITVAVKEKHAIAGRLVSEGSRAWSGRVPTENAPIVDRLLDAGAIIHARTTTPEFSLVVFTHSDLWGVTRNPWNRAFSPGGSSGGSAAALAAGMTTLATASDIGGSTRGPAAFTGTVGFKAPYGRVPGSGPLALDYYRGDSGLARTVDDMALMMNQIAGPDDRDPSSVAPAYVLPPEFDDIAGMRIGLVAEPGEFEVDTEVSANARACGGALHDAGADVSEVDLPVAREEISAAVSTHFAQMTATMVRRHIGQNDDALTDYACSFLHNLESVAASGVRMYDAATSEYAVQQTISGAMRDCDALIMPTTAAPAFVAGDPLLDNLVINGKDVPPFEGLLTFPFNIANRHPVLNVPSGQATNGMPTGVQIIAHRYDDSTAFRVGKALERLRPWGFDPIRKSQKTA